MPKKIPKFKNEKDEQEFWSTHDSADYLDWNRAKMAEFPKLKPSTKSISLRLPESMLNQVRILANKNDIPYQSLIKLFIQEGIHKKYKGN